MRKLWKGLCISFFYLYMFCFWKRSIFYFSTFFKFLLPYFSRFRKRCQGKIQSNNKKAPELLELFQAGKAANYLPAPHLSSSAILTDGRSGRFFPAIFSPRKTCVSAICKILHPCPPFNSGLFLIPPIRSGETIWSFHFRAANFPMSARHTVRNFREIPWPILRISFRLRLLSAKALRSLPSHRRLWACELMEKALFLLAGSFGCLPDFVASF